MVNPKKSWFYICLVYSVAIAVLSVLPPKAEASLVPFSQGDKLLHFLAFFAFSLLVWKAGPAKPRISSTLLLTIAYSGAIEFVQLLAPYRTASILDWLAGSLGGLAGAWAAYTLQRFALPAHFAKRILPKRDRNEE